VQKIVETLARFVREKNFQPSLGFPTIPAQKRLETMAKFLRRKKFETWLDFQQSQCKNVLKLWLDL